MKFPKIIALCGNPGAGKSTAAELLSECYEYEIVDDGLPMRKIAMEYFGLTHDQAFTQEGKKETVSFAGNSMEAREYLGKIGNAFEAWFGQDSVPAMSLKNMKAGGFYVLGSVRREQGLFWKKHGALVLEIRNPDAGPSKFEFDCFSQAAVDKVIINDGLNIGLSEDYALLRLARSLELAISEHAMSGAA